MAGGGGSTGGIGAQSPAVNPPNPMGQMGNAIGGAFGGALGNMNQQPYNQTGPMGNPIGGELARYGGELGTFGPPNPTPGQMPLGQIAPDPSMMDGAGFTPGFGNNSQLGQLGSMATPPSQTYEGYLAGRSPMQQDVQLTRDQWQQGQNQMGSVQPGLGQPAGLMALLGGQPRPAPAMALNPGKPAPVASQPRPAPATKPVAKPTVVPPKTPPAVANAIQKLAAQKQSSLR